MYTHICLYSPEWRLASVMPKAVPALCEAGSQQIISNTTTNDH